MKQIFLSVILLMTAFAVSADELQYKLVKYSDNTGHEAVTFHYNEQHRLVAVHTIEYGADGYECIDSLTYDNNGNIIKICGWQLLSGSFKWVNYVDYTYDAQNRITSRTNYNLFDTGWEMGGIYTYTYDGEGNHTLTQLTMGGELFQEIEYIYDNGMLKDEIWKMSDYAGGLEVSEKLSYTYDAEDRLILTYDSTFDGDFYELYRRHNYSYNEAGNCEYHKMYDNANNEIERQAYTFNNMLRSETLYPINPEMTRPHNIEYNVNNYTTEEYWTLDVNFHLQHMCDYTYEYVGINESGVDDVNETAIQQVLSIKKVMIDGRLYIECGDKVFDINGRRVK